MVLHFLPVVYKLTIIVLPPALRIASDHLKASGSIDENYSAYIAKVKTLCAVRDDLKNRTIHCRSTNKQTLDDWFDRVMDVEEDAKKLEIKFTKLQGSLRVFSRAQLSKKVAKRCLKFVELQKEGNQLRDIMVPRKLHMFYKFIIVLMFLYLFALPVYKLY